MGNRWSLLIVRELLVGPARYGRPLEGLPGTSTNLLADRLRELEQTGVVQRQLDTDSNGVAYALTPWGSELRGTVAALVNWSTPLMVSGPPGARFQAHWLVVAIESLMAGKRTEVPATVGLEVDGTVITVHLDNNGAHISSNVHAHPETVLRADPMVALGIASGMLTVEQAITAGDMPTRMPLSGAARCPTRRHRGRCRSATPAGMPWSPGSYALR